MVNVKKLLKKEVKDMKKPHNMCGLFLLTFAIGMFVNANIYNALDIGLNEIGDRAQTIAGCDGIKEILVDYMNSDDCFIYAYVPTITIGGDENWTSVYRCVDRKDFWGAANYVINISNYFAPQIPKSPRALKGGEAVDCELISNTIFYLSELYENITCEFYASEFYDPTSVKTHTKHLGVKCMELDENIWRRLY